MRCLCGSKRHRPLGGNERVYLRKLGDGGLYTVCSRYYSAKHIFPPWYGHGCIVSCGIILIHRSRDRHPLQQPVLPTKRRGSDRKHRLPLSIPGTHDGRIYREKELHQALPCASLQRRRVSRHVDYFECSGMPWIGIQHVHGLDMVQYRP